MSTTPTPPQFSPFAVFRNRNFSLLWTGELVSTMGSALTSLAASILIFRLTNSALSVGLMLMATAAPSLLVGLFAGVLVDRFNRKRIMIAADLTRAVLVVLIPILVPFNILWLYGIVMACSAIGQFFDPAHESVLPEVATDAELAAANSLIAISSFGSTAIGFAASGLIAAAANINWAFYIDAISFLFSAACILLIRIKPIQASDEANIQMILRNLKSGIKQLLDTPVLRSLFYGQIPTLIAFGMSNALLLPFAIKALKATEFEYGIQEGLTSLGFVICSLLIAGIFDRWREGAWIATSYIGMAAVRIVYSFVHSIPLAIAIIAISGFFNAPSSIGRRLVIQRNTPREMRGRVSSAFFVSRDVLFLVGMGIAGLADLIDVRIMYLASALLLLVGGIFVLVLPGLRQNREEWKHALQLLRTAPAVAGLNAGYAAKPTDFDSLAVLLPSLNGLNTEERKSLVAKSCIIEVLEGTPILKHGDTSDSVYFILSGRTVAGLTSADGSYRSLSTMTAGDFFGEIAALTGLTRTADVVAEQKTTLMQVPAEELRKLMANPVLEMLFMTKMKERLNRTSINELPRFASIDQRDAQELRKEVESA